MFEYIEVELPYARPPLFNKIEQLVGGVNLFGYQMLGDPKKLESVKLSELHPASWFCGEQWFELREPRFKLQSDGSSQTDRAEVLRARLKTLQYSASVISKAVVPRATGEAMNHHPDYEFFRSRSG
ncbi:hypothetical protein ACP70R_033175 [Stipagrostis hirtigluma subsp. patula]